MAEAEIEALQAIYCEENEFILLQKGWNQGSDTIFSMNITVKHANDEADSASSKPYKMSAPVQVTFTLPNDYPNSIPAVAIGSSNITRGDSIKMKEDIHKYAGQLLGEPMIMDLVMWIQQNASQYSHTTCAKHHEDGTILPEQATLAECRDHFTVLLHLDHMRAKARYVKTIQKWTEELGLYGRLLFLDKLIFILLQGRETDIKGYISRQRTVNVDVDSKGRSCKERMLTVLTNCRTLVIQKRFEDFKVVECSSTEQLHTIFLEHGLSSLYDENVLPVLRR